MLMLGAELTARREAAGLTLQQLAAQLGVRPGTLATWERVHPPIGWLGRVNAALTTRAQDREPS